MKNLTKAQLMDQLTEARNVIDRQRIVIAELEAKVSAKATVVEVAPVITVEKAVQGDKAKAILWSALKKHEKVSLNCLQEAFKDVSFKKALDEAWAKGYSANIVLAALRQEGIKSSNEAIRMHKQGLCKCEKK
jgi:hypothetical protein